MSLRLDLQGSGADSPLGSAVLRKFGERDPVCAVLPLRAAELAASVPSLRPSTVMSPDRLIEVLPPAFPPSAPGCEVPRGALRDCSAGLEIDILSADIGAEVDIDADAPGGVICARRSDESRFDDAACGMMAVERARAAPLLSEDTEACRAPPCCMSSRATVRMGGVLVKRPDATCRVEERPDDDTLCDAAARRGMPVAAGAAAMGIERGRDGDEEGTTVRLGDPVAARDATCCMLLRAAAFIAGGDARVSRDDAGTDGMAGARLGTQSDDPNTFASRVVRATARVSVFIDLRNVPASGGGIAFIRPYPR